MSQDLADKVFSQYIRERDRGCVRCFSRDSLECAHILGRHYRIIRCDPDNAVALCHGCHRWFTNHPVSWEIFIESRHPGRFALLRDRVQSMVTPDWTETVKEIRNLMDELRRQRGGG